MCSSSFNSYQGYGLYTWTKERKKKGWSNTQICIRVKSWIQQNTAVVIEVFILVLLKKSLLFRKEEETICIVNLMIFSSILETTEKQILRRHFFSGLISMANNLIIYCLARHIHQRFQNLLVRKIKKKKILESILINLELFLRHNYN